MKDWLLGSYDLVGDCIDTPVEICSSVPYKPT